MAGFLLFYFGGLVDFFEYDFASAGIWHAIKIQKREELSLARRKLVVCKCFPLLSLLLVMRPCFFEIAKSLKQKVL